MSFVKTCTWVVEIQISTNSWKVQFQMSWIVRLVQLPKFVFLHFQAKLMYHKSALPWSSVLLRYICKLKSTNKLYKYSDILLINRCDNGAGRGSRLNPAHKKPPKETWEVQKTETNGACGHDRPKHMLTSWCCLLSIESAKLEEADKLATCDKCTEFNHRLID